MKRRINYTGRAKIPRSRIDIRLRQESGGIPWFDIQFDVSDMGFPPDAKVFVEAYYKAIATRFDFGTAAMITAPENRELSEIRSDIVFFRVKVVDIEGSQGLILGLADRISAGLEAQATSLLHVSTKDLGNQLWKLNLENDFPVLEVNNNFQAEVPIREIVRTDPIFRSLVFPAVFREILNRILLVEEETDTEGEGWMNLWLRFSCALPGIADVTKLPNPPNSYLIDYVEWIDQAVESFCRENAFAIVFERGLDQRR